MDSNISIRNRASNTLVQEEAKSQVENELRETKEEKLAQGENGEIEEDIIIKCGLDEMVKRFFKEYVIVWHDPNMSSEENKQYIVQLEKFCEVYTFTEWKEASAYVASAKAACHVITSGRDGELLVKDICLNQSVLKIYVFCENKDYHLTWTKNYEKVSCVENQIQNILDKIKQNLLEWYQKESSLKNNLPAFAPIFNDWDKSGMNNLHRYLKVIPNFKNCLQAKTDILILSRAIFSDKRNKSLMIDFEKNYNEYNKESILKWYTRESFLFKITNNCLRIASSDSIQYCRLVLKDLEQAIKEQYQEKSRCFDGLLFRGASLSDDEWLNLKANLNREIEILGFLSTSKDKNQALKFMEMDSSKNVFITILVPKGPSEEEQGFAEVEEFSNFTTEKEVLFNVRSRFTVLEAEDQYSKDLPYRHLVLLYGAQGFRKYVASKNPVQGILIPNLKEIWCSICHDKILQSMFFTPLIFEQVQKYLCKRCLPEFFEDNQFPLSCISQDRLVKEIKLPGILMTYPTKLRVPMYGYNCCECQAKEQKIYYQCIECSRERRKAWCESCIVKLSECFQKEHNIILESNPFSFWCEEMSKKESDHLKFQNENSNCNLTLQQGQMYFESHEYQKALKFYQIVLSRTKEKVAKYLNLLLAEIIVFAHKQKSQAGYMKALQDDPKAPEIVKRLDEDENQKAYEEHSKTLKIYRSLWRDKSYEVATFDLLIGNVYNSRAEYQKALEYYSEALEIYKSFYGENHPKTATSCHNLGNVFFSQAKYQKAFEFFSRALEIRKSLYGDNHPSVAISYDSLGHFDNHQANYEKAFEFFSSALEIRKSIYGDNHPSAANSFHNISIVYYNQGKYQKAIEYQFKTLEIRKSFYGDNHPSIANFFHHISCVYWSQAKYQKSIEYQSKALEITKSFYGENHPNTANSWNALGLLYCYQANSEKAFEYLSKALRVQTSLYGDNHPSVATSWNNLGLVYNHQANYEKAFEYQSKGFEIFKFIYGDNHPEVATFYSNIGNLYHNQANYEKAFEYHSKAFEIRKSFYDDNHPSVAISYNSLGITERCRANYGKAFEYFSKALQIYKSIFEENHPEVAASYNNLGIIYNSQGDYEKAFEYHSKAQEIYKFMYGENHHGVAATYGCLGNLYNCLAEYQKALEYHSKALEIKNSFYGNNHPYLGNSFEGLGKSYFSFGDPNKALEYYLKSLEIKKLVFNDHHPDLAIIYCYIGHAYNKLEDQNKALEYHLKSLEIKKIALHDNHPQIAESFTGIGRVHYALGEYEKALDYHCKSLEIRKSVFHENHPHVATCYHDIANVLKSKRKYKKAQEYYLKSLEIRKQVFGENHSFVRDVSDQIRSLTRIEDAERESGLKTDRVEEFIFMERNL